QPCRGNPALAPISLARAMRQDMKHELQRMEEQQEMRNARLEQLVSDTAGQRSGQVRSCRSTPTTTGLFGDTAETNWSLLEELEEGNGDCSSCSFNIRAYLGKLLQRCEKLQGQVDSLESRHMAMGKFEKMMRNWGQYHIFPSLELEQDQERLHYVETTVLQMQGDCEKLSFVS
ncbi:QRIC2 protein, partial [Leptocoma aspasia]|nr:QRIC2 protein [Leptocoma aspasia]